MKLFEDASVELGHPTPAPIGKQLRVVQLEGVANGRVGAVLARVPLPDLSCHGYQVVQLQEGGTAARSVDQSLNNLLFAPSPSLSFPIPFLVNGALERKFKQNRLLITFAK